MRILSNDDSLKIIIDKLVSSAKKSTCHISKCGSIIVNNGQILGVGYNSMPCDEIGECFKDTLSPTFKSDKTCCIHAEQRAIMDALSNFNKDIIKGSQIFFIRLNDSDEPKHSGKPYCSICSKMALDCGISEFVLWHNNGWTAYDTDEYNKLTFEYS